MRLSDIMSQLDLSVYPQAALVIFLGVFIAVTWRVLGRSRGGELARAARMPLDDAGGTSAAGAAGRSS